MIDVILKKFETPDEVRNMLKGKFEIVRLGGLTIGRATYQPGWKWSVDVGAGIGATVWDGWNIKQLPHPKLYQRFHLRKRPVAIPEITIPTCSTEQ